MTLPATFMYDNARSLFATAQINWPTCAAHALLVSATYAPQPGDMNLSAIPSGARIIDVAMTGLGQTKGICYGVIPEFNAFTSVSQVVALVIYIHGSDDAHSPLLYYSADGKGFPWTAVGFNYDVAFDQAYMGFFQV